MRGNTAAHPTTEAVRTGYSAMLENGEHFAYAPLATG